MKKFAFFLPQFHTIPENDEWWGEGFTEWTNVKRAKPLFNGHIQPNYPKDRNYYVLTDKKTVLWQTDLLNKYDVDGLIYYHYYFCGKKLLEKPAENLLKWKDINQKFFFCWANHSWNRSWNGSKEILVEQKYGKQKEWEEHFKYLLDFFRDSRYEKKDNKPVFMIYDSMFYEKKEMFNYFEKRCIEEGFAGLFLIETYMGSNDWINDLKAFRENVSSQTEKIFFREFNVSGKIFTQTIKYYPYRFVRRLTKLKNKIINKKHIEIYDGNVFFDIIMKLEPYDKNIIHGLFFEWDNTPRHGERGSLVTPPSKKNFFKALDKLKDEEYVFFNAWNEWAEGMVMEPTEENGYKYLEWIKEWSQKNVK